MEQDEPAELEIEAGEVRDLRFRCIEGCGHCCLCEPALRPAEVTFFAEGFPDRIGPSLIDPETTALRLQGGEGACTFLDGGRKCTVYEKRPFYCRMYPVHITSTWRLQAVGNRSCRGLWLGPSEERLVPLPRVLQEGIATVDPDDAAAVLEETTAMYRGLTGWTGPGSARVAMERAAIQGTRKIMAPPAAEARLRLAEAEEDTTRVFAADRLIQLPIYTDAALRWWAIRWRASAFTGQLIDATGAAIEEVTAPPEEVRELAARQVASDAITELDAYTWILSARDITIARAAKAAGSGGARLTARALGDVTAALWSIRHRAALLACLAAGRERRPRPANLDAGAIREGIILFDQDLLDRPFLGAFL